VMDREFTKSFACEFTPAPRTDPGKKLERSLPIALLPKFPVAQGLGNELTLLVIIWLRLFSGHVQNPDLLIGLNHRHNKIFYLKNINNKTCF